MTDLLASITTKIHASERHAPGPDPEILEAKKTNAEKLKSILPEQPRPAGRKPRQTAGKKRGRPRTRTQTLKTGSVHPQTTIGAWATERLIQAEDFCEYVCGFAVHTITRRNGVMKRHTPTYLRLSLREDYQRFCQQKNYPPASKGKQFIVHLLAVLNERGIPTRLDRSQRERRKILWGVCLRDQRGWRGNEALL